MTIKLTKGSEQILVDPGSIAEERWRERGFLAEGEKPKATPKEAPKPAAKKPAAKKAAKG